MFHGTTRRGAAGWLKRLRKSAKWPLGEGVEHGGRRRCSAQKTERSSDNELTLHWRVRTPLGEDALPSGRSWAKLSWSTSLVLVKLTCGVAATGAGDRLRPSNLAAKFRECQARAPATLPWTFSITSDQPRPKRRGLKLFRQGCRALHLLAQGKVVRQVVTVDHGGDRSVREHALARQPVGQGGNAQSLLGSDIAQWLAERP